MSLHQIISIVFLCGLSIADQIFYFELNTTCKDIYPSYCPQWFETYCSWHEPVREYYCHYTCHKDYCDGVGTTQTPTPIQESSRLQPIRSSGPDEVARKISQPLEPKMVEDLLRCRPDPSLKLSAALKTDANNFAMKLLETASRQSGGTQNLGFSPISIFMALGTLLQASGGGTRSALKQAILPTVPEGEILESLRSMTAALNRDSESFELTTADGLFHSADLRLKADFEREMRACFNLTIREIANFENGARLINRWAEEKTNGRIRNLISDDFLPGDSSLLLLNAVYFKAEWSQSFKERLRLINLPFHRLEQGENPKMVKMLHLDGKFKYFNHKKLQVLGIPYKNHELTFFIFLPKNVRFSSLESFFTENQHLLQIVMSRTEEKEVDVFVPEFALAETLNLKNIAQSLGLGAVFESGADFSRLSPDSNLSVSKIIHKSVLMVNENGTEAASTTFVDIRFTSGGGPEVFLADHPFLFAIRHQKTKLILFMGRVIDID